MKRLDWAHQAVDMGREALSVVSDMLSRLRGEVGDLDKKIAASTTKMQGVKGHMEDIRCRLVLLLVVFARPG